MQFIFHTSNLSKAYDEKTILKDINLSFYYGAKIGVVGENGTGKSTLLKIMAGVDNDFFGDAAPAKGTRIGYLPQEPELDPGLDVRGNLELAFAPVKKLIDEYEEVTNKMAEDISPEEMEKAMDKMAKLQDEIDAVDGWEIDRMLEIAADALVLPPDDMDVTKLSGGERRRVALCKILLERPDLLLLDEPTNHLDAETVEWLEGHLREYPGTVIIVTHDRYFLDNITKWILELDRGRGIPFEGNYSSWLEQKAARLSLEEKAESSRRKAIQRELDWIRSSPQGRQAKSKARIKNYETMLDQEVTFVDNAVDIQIAPGKRLGESVIKAENITKAYGDNVLIKDLSFDLPPGAVVGVIGPNGVGKTTLFKMLVEQEKPDSGEITIGPTVEMAYIDQHRDDLDGDKTIFEEISGGSDELIFGNKSIKARGYVSRFNFRGANQQKPVKNLSGGERNRVHLAKLLRRGGNVILLDEPTNDLDVGTLRYLEQGILNFAGCVLVVSHDRFFLDRICSHLLVFDGDSHVRWFEGNFQAYEDKLREERGDKADRPRRSKYKKLSLK